MLQKRNLSEERGFTLLELLVVIAGIALLSSLMLVGVAQRERDAQDKAIIGELDQVRKQAEAFYVTNGTYQGLCNASQNLTELGRLGELKASIQEKGGELKCMSSASDYAVSSSLPSGDYWCVDSQGASRQIDSAVESTSCSD